MRSTLFWVLAIVCVLPWILGTWALGVLWFSFCGFSDLWSTSLGFVFIPLWIALIRFTAMFDPAQ